MIKVYYALPNSIQNVLITVRNTIMWHVRTGRKGNRYLRRFSTGMLRGSVNDLVRDEKRAFMQALEQNEFYKNIDLDNLILSKEDLVSNHSLIRNLDFSIYQPFLVGKTGGSTGASLKFHIHRHDLQKKYGVLRWFWRECGFILGQECAWFSGKELLSQRDVEKSIYWKRDYVNNITFYSTFHVNSKTAEHYIAELNRTKPKALIGFPSTLVLIAEYGRRKSLEISFEPKCILTTAETLTKDVRFKLREFYGADVYDQYGSSEGAPIILECAHGRMHLVPSTGSVDVINGKVVVSGYLTKGFPLYNYDIGDIIEIVPNDICNCNWCLPVVKSVKGRKIDHIVSPHTGYINLGNITNTLKGVDGINFMQVCQTSEDSITVFLVVNNQSQEVDKNLNLLKANWRKRVGKMNISFELRDAPFRTKGGKMPFILRKDGNYE